jgi:hypothetical protein
MKLDLEFPNSEYGVLVGQELAWLLISECRISEVLPDSFLHRFEQPLTARMRVHYDDNYWFVLKTAACTVNLVSPAHMPEKHPGVILRPPKRR